MATNSPQQPAAEQFVSIKFENGVLVASPVGPNVGERESSIVDAQVTAAIEELSDPLRWFVLDMRRVEFMPSVGIGVCINLHNVAKAKGAKGSVALGLQPSLAELFKMMRLTKIFKLADDDKAVAKIVRK